MESILDNLMLHMFDYQDRGSDEIMTNWNKLKALYFSSELDSTQKMLKVNAFLKNLKNE